MLFKLVQNEIIWNNWWLLYRQSNYKWLTLWYSFLSSTHWNTNKKVRFLHLLKLWLLKLLLLLWFNGFSFLSELLLIWISNRSLNLQFSWIVVELLDLKRTTIQIEHLNILMVVVLLFLHCCILIGLNNFVAFGIVDWIYLDHFALLLFFWLLLNKSNFVAWLVLANRDGHWMKIAFLSVKLDRSIVAWSWACSLSAIRWISPLSTTTHSIHLLLLNWKLIATLTWLIYLDLSLLPDNSFIYLNWSFNNCLLNWFLVAYNRLLRFLLLYINRLNLFLR